jgi:hypothetical protein
MSDWNQSSMKKVCFKMHVSDLVMCNYLDIQDWYVNCVNWPIIEALSLCTWEWNIPLTRNNIGKKYPSLNTISQW